MKNYKILILLVLLVVGGGIFYRFRQPTTTPKSVTPTDYYDLTTKKITVKNIDFGNTTGLKKATAKLLTAQDLAKKLGFKTEPQKEVRALTWSEGSRELLVNASAAFDFSDDARAKKGSLKNSTEAEKVATDFIHNVGLLENDFAVKVAKVDLIIEGRNYSPDFASAKFLAVHFDITYLDKLIYFQPEGQTRLEVWVDKQGNVTRFTGPLLTVSRDPQDASLRNPKEVLSELREGKGKIVKITQIQTPSSGKGENLSYSQLSFDRGEIVYRFDSGQIEPVYQAVGQAKNPDQKELNIYVHLTALQ